MGKSKKSKKVVASAGRSWWLWVAVAAAVASFAVKTSTGNPTQRVGKLWEMMVNGMAGNEDVSIKTGESLAPACQSALGTQF